MGKQGEDIMKFFINDMLEPEKYFWNSLQGLASPNQVYRLLDGDVVFIGGVKYSILFTNE